MLPFISVPLSFMGCASTPERPPLAQKWDNARHKSYQLLKNCQLQQALEQTGEMLRLAQLRDDRLAMAESLRDLANVSMELGDFRAADEWFLQSALKYRRLGDAVGLLEVDIGRGIIQLMLGNLEQGIDRLEKALPRTDQLQGGADSLRVTIHNGLAMAKRRRGQLAEALEHLVDAENFARRAEGTPQLATTLMNRSRVLFDRGEIFAAEVAVTQALDLDRGAENIRGTVSDLVMMASIAEKRGMLVEARDHWLQAVVVFEHCGLAKERDASQAQAEIISQQLRQAPP
ncbi:MAG TPA: tetratricopeptide repeat protein [Magnetococcales bacterium]|nr:tetratricopeptide repeat protein [Magnetococcales bacterium]